MKKSLILFMVLSIILSTVFPICAVAEFTGELDCAAAILIEADSGTVLYEKNADTAYPPASVTKIMTLLLVCEAIDAGVIRLTDNIPVSENAAGMGGSQVFLKAGEEITLHDMLKSVAVASANDCAVALAEHISGSEEAFVRAMNNRAAELGMVNTNFENATGLDDTTVNHVTSARDISIMSSELMKHEYIFDYSTVWMDTIRNGVFGLTNTNKLIRFYNGANGLKTGMTAKAKFCISATAKRDGMQLIAVIMASPSSDVRNACAKKLLDYGFANYGVYRVQPSALDEIELKGGVNDSVGVEHGLASFLLAKADMNKVTYTLELPDYVNAPLKKGDSVGQITFYINEDKLGHTDIVLSADAPRATFGNIFIGILRSFLMAGQKY